MVSFAAESNKLHLRAVQFGLSNTVAYNAIVQEETTGLKKAIDFLGKVLHKVGVQ